MSRGIEIVCHLLDNYHLYERTLLNHKILLLQTIEFEAGGTFQAIIE